MDKPKVFVTRMIPEEGINLLKESCTVDINPHDRPLTREELLSSVQHVDGVIGLLSERIDDEFFDSARSIKGYANYAVGFDNIDLSAATKRGIPVSNTPDVLTNATAEMAWALLFAVARHIVASDRKVRSENWKGWSPLQFIGGDVTGKTLGIVGAGRIGKAMACMSAGFSMEVLYFNRSRKMDLEERTGAKQVGFEELLEKSDFISLHTPLTEDTKHMFSYEAFKKMKKTAYLINTARGPVVNEAALVQALEEHEIAGAGLDVYEFEPKLAPGLSRLDNVVIAPHTGSATVNARRDMATLAARNLLQMLKGVQSQNCLNPDIYK